MCELGEKSNEYPHGYGLCQCGCGNETRIVAGIHLRYSHPSHNPNRRAKRRANSDRRIKESRSQTGRSQQAASDPHTRELELVKEIAEIRSAMRKWRPRRKRVRVASPPFNGQRRPRDIIKQSPLLRRPVRPEVWDALSRNIGFEGRLLPEVIRAIQQRCVSHSEVSRVLGIPIHTVAQW